MSEGLNKVLLLGNLGSDPELKVIPGGQPVLRLRLACSESYVDKNNVRQERTEWMNVSIWGKRGEGLAKILTKGDRIFVEGSLRTRSYEKDGEKRYATEINATNIILSGGGRRSDAGGGDRPAAAEQRPASRAAEPRQAPPPSDFGGGGYADDDEIPF